MDKKGMDKKGIYKKDMHKLFFVFLLGALSAAYATDIGLSPPRLTLTGSPGETLTETVTLITDAAEPLQISAEINDWTLGSAGDISFFPAGSVAYSAAGWTALENTDFFLPAHSSLDLRVSITIPEDAEGGTYHEMVFFEVVPPAVATSGVGVVTTTRIGLTIYVTVAGSEQNGAEVVDFFQGDDGLTLAVANTGNTLMRLGGHIELRDETGEVAHTLDVPDMPVLRDSERELTLALPEDVTPGFYLALALIEDGRGELLVAELPISLP